MKLIIKTLFWHIFPFGWFFSIGGAIIFWSFLITVHPVLKYKVNIASGKVLRIGLPHVNMFADGNDQCYNTVYVKMFDAKIFGASENCENITQKDIGRKVTLKYIDISQNQVSGYNKILFLEEKKVNNYLGQSELMCFVLFLWGGLFLYIAFRDIKNEYNRQLEKEEKRKNESPSQFNYDKFN